MASKQADLPTLSQASSASRVPRRIPGGELAYVPDFIASRDADGLLAELLALSDWEQPLLHLFGRAVSTPRMVAFYGDPGVSYAYSGFVHDARPWPPGLASLRARLARDHGLRLNAVLANLYRDGRDSMGWHSDDERDLGPRPVIASVSLGAERRFLLRHRTRKDLETLDLPLAHGSLLVMKGDTQRHWKHSVPKTARCREPRVNLTFRRVR